MRNRGCDIGDAQPSLRNKGCDIGDAQPRLALEAASSLWLVNFAGILGAGC